MKKCEKFKDKICIFPYCTDSCYEINRLLEEERVDGYSSSTFLGDIITETKEGE